MLRVGRLENMEVVLQDSSISRRHAEVTVGDQGWVVRDLGSLNGTFLNGVRVGRADRKLRRRDVLQCGNLVMVVAVLEEDIPVANEPAEKNMEVQAFTSNTWEKALEAAASLDEENRPRAGDKLMTLLRASYHLCHTASLDELLRSILEDAVSCLKAQRGAIVLAEEGTENLILRAVSTGDKENAGSRVNYSKSMALRSFQRQESLLCRDVATNPELLLANSIADGAMSSIICALLRSPRKRLGVLHLDRGPLQEPFSQDDLHLSDALAASVSAAIESAQLLEKQRDIFLQTVTALAQAVEIRDPYTGGHTQRVTDYSLLLAEELKVSGTDRRHIQIGTPLHDIGKIGIDDAILRKPGRLTSDEFEVMKTHTVKGAAILQTIPDLGLVIPIVRNHHECWDGSGYPDKLSGEQIPRLARIVAVADAFDAMTSDRPYRKGMPAEKAYAEIETRAGSQFDPQVASAFIQLRPRVEELLQQYFGAPRDTLTHSRIVDMVRPAEEARPISTE
jgi:HD-GYP domain-containing protein (c-di-GMP phosphodiesterase class II)